MISAATDAADPGQAAAQRDSSKRARIVGLLFSGVWLLYLIQPVAGLFNRHNSPLYIAGGLTIIGVFCAVYLAVVPRWPLSPRSARPALGALAALAVLDCVLYGRGAESTTLWIFVSSASGLLVVRPRRAIRAVLGCAGGYVIFSLTGHVDRTDFLLNLLPAVFVGLAMIGLRHQFELTNELRQAREEVAKLAASQERLRLARDLHDLTGQSLSMITLKSELAARLLRRLPAGSDRDRAIAETEEVAAVGRQTLHDIREAVSGYRRPTLAVEVITARTALESAGITPYDDPDLILLSGRFDPDAEAALAWCLREAATNVIRHSGARNCHISLARHARDLSLEVRDDGAGRAAAPAGGPGAVGPGASSGMGLRGMSERLAAVGGDLKVRPSAHGFCLVARVPADAASHDRSERDDRDDRDRGDDRPRSRRGINVTS